MPCRLPRCSRLLSYHLVGTRYSPNERLWKIRLCPRNHSALTPANFTTLPHFSVSSAMSLPKSAGGPTSGVAPRSASCALIFRSASALLISLLSLSMTSGGVLLGEPKPDPPLRLVARQELTHVGTSGSASERVAASRSRSASPSSSNGALYGPPHPTRRLAPPEILGQIDDDVAALASAEDL